MRYKYRQIEHIIQSHRRIVNNAYARPREKNIKATRYAWRFCNGAPKRIRTANRQNRNLMRYPVAPWVHICILSFFAVFVERKRTIGAFSTRISGSIETFRLF